MALLWIEARVALGLPPLDVSLYQGGLRESVFDREPYEGFLQH